MDALKSFIGKDGGFRFGGRPFERTTVYLCGIAAVFAGLVSWAALCDVDKITRMEGKIIPQGHSRPVQHLEGGIVASIEAVEGAVVRENDLLLVIDATSAGANLNESKSKIKSLNAKAVRLRAESVLAKELSFTDPDITETETRGEQALFLSRKNKLEQELRMHQETVRQHAAALSEIDAKEQSLKSELIVAAKRSQMIEAMAAKRAASQMELLDAQSREKRLETEIADAEASRPKIKAALAGEQARIASMYADFKAQAQGELVSVQAEIDRLNQTVSAVEDRVKRTDVRAPITGVVNRMSIRTAGAVVKPGETILEITPTSNEIMLEGRIRPGDRGDLQTGIPAKVRVSAYDYGHLGVLTGKLMEISADTLEDKSGEPYYRGKILVSNVPASYTEHPLLPGMTVTADLVSGRRSILGYILSPLSKFTSTAFRGTR